MTFRRATSQDSEQIIYMVFSVLKEYGLQPDPGSTDIDLGNLDRHYFSQGGYFEVIEEAGKIVGSWGLYPLESQSCELRKMYLLGSHRGKGLGKTMLNRSLSKAKDLGFRRVELETASVLKEAISLYKKYGFYPVTGKHLASRCDQAYELWL